MSHKTGGYMKLKHKTIIILTSLMLSFSLIFCNSIGCSAAAKYKLPGFPPASQTSYKQFSNIYTTVGSIKKFGKSLQGKGSVGTAIGSVGYKIPFCTWVSAVGGGVYISGHLVERSVSKFKNKSKIHMITYFKWKNSNRKNFKYTMKKVSYITYKEKKVTKTYTSVESGDAGELFN